MNLLRLSLFGFCISALTATAPARASDFFADETSELLAPETIFSDLDVPTAEEVRAPCRNKVDPNKVLLFVDTNSAYREALVAKKSACDRGLRFESIPSLEASYLTGIALEQLTVARTRKSYYDDHCKANPHQCDPVRQAALAAELAARENNAAAVAQPYAYDAAEAFSQKVNQLAQQRAKVKVLILSGHHYQYGYWGDYLTRGTRLHDDEHGPYGSDIAGPARSHAEVFSELDAMAAWACSGVTPGKIAEYTGYFPSLRLIAGYNNTAPNSIRPANLAYLKSFLRQVPSLLQSKDASAVRARIGGLDSIRETFAGLFIRVQNKQYLYQVYAPRSGPGGARWIELDATNRCEVFLKRLPSEILSLQAYESGRDPIPSDTDGSPLKHIYFDIQINEDCLAGRPEATQWSSPRVGLLRFFESGVRLNFAARFRTELETATRELRAPHYRQAGWKFIPKDIRAGSLLSLLGSGSLYDYILNAPRSRILELFQAYRTVLKSPPNSKDIGTRSAEHVYTLIKKLLIELHPECTEMLSWHEPHPANPPGLSCRI